MSKILRGRRAGLLFVAAVLAAWQPASAQTSFRMGAGKVKPPSSGQLKSAKPADRGSSSGVLKPMNAGSGNANTVYHYTDRLVPPGLLRTYPYRASGKWYFKWPDDENWYQCTASLIGKSLLLTAAHCVNRGGVGGVASWIEQGYFYPAYDRGPSQYGSAAARFLSVTDNWYSIGPSMGGYDVAIVGLSKQLESNVEIGTLTGFYRFCRRNCLKTYWFSTQPAYPLNYYAGQQMTEGQHLMVSNGYDYIMGSGMRSGVSGSPHVTNIGHLQDSEATSGISPGRNVIFAVTSFLSLDPAEKTIGAASLSGPNNDSGIIEMYNAMCADVRTLHGADLCTPIP